jgi:adenylate kinase family enzyme
MKRICVLGCSGAGKTTLATEIAARTGLPHHSLDSYYWKPGWTPTAKDDWFLAHRRLIDEDAWVIDGNYFSTLVSRVAAADTIVFVDLARWRCLYRIAKRTLRWWGRTRPDMGEDCPESLDLAFLRYIWNFKAVHRPHILGLLDDLSGGQIVHIRNERERTAFLAGL